MIFAVKFSFRSFEKWSLLNIAILALVWLIIPNTVAIYNDNKRHLLHPLIITHLLSTNYNIVHFFFIMGLLSHQRIYRLPTKLQACIFLHIEGLPVTLNTDYCMLRA